MYEDRLPFGILLFLGLLAAGPVALFYVCKGAFLCVKGLIAYNRQQKAARVVDPFAVEHTEQPRPRRNNTSKKKSHDAEAFSAWIWYNYQENVRNDQIYRGLY